MKRRHLLMLFAATAPARAFASVVYYMAAVDPADLPSLDRDPRRLGTLLLETSGPANLYLDKAWDGLHWILTGSAKYDSTALLSELLLGGSKLSTQLPYGRPRLHSAQQVQKFSQRLRAETEATLRSRYAPSEMDRQDVYPGGWEEDPEEGFAYLLSAYRELTEFIHISASGGKAVLCSWS